jgi:hypothetical protein
MTLIVSFRTPEGIVIAGDSLSTLTTKSVEGQNVNINCPNCNQSHQVNIPTNIAPQSTFSYTQKIFPFYKKYGIGTFGIASLLDRSIRFVIRSIENNLKNESVIFSSVKDVASRIGNEVHNLLVQQLALEKRLIDSVPVNSHLLGLQVVGYDDDIPKTIETFIGRHVSHRITQTAGYTNSGQSYVIKEIQRLYNQPLICPAFEAFSLQDAIDYVDFLINTTIQYQRFTRVMPNVGGSIDIGLITPFDNFQWIRQKSLDKILEGEQ